MQRIDIRDHWLAVAGAAALLAGSAAMVRAEGPFLTVTGGGTAAFDPGEELEGYSTRFSVSARVSDVPVENACDAALDGLGVGDYTVTDGEGFVAANGHFNCTLMIQEEGVGFLMILGDILQARVNEDGSVTLCGLADIPIDTFSGEQFVDCPFAVTFRADESGFTYYDVVTAPPGDAETIVNGAVKIQ